MNDIPPQGTLLNFYTYEAAGFDNFLLRSIDSNQSNLDSSSQGEGGGSAVKQLDLDRMQSSGGFGDSVTIGNITIDGVAGRISVFDDDHTEVAQFGKLDD